MQTKEWEVLKVMLEIVSIPFCDSVNPLDSAILILPGIYQEYRITEGVKLWPSKARYLWVAGTYGDPFYSREKIISYCRKDSADIIVAESAKHTRDQMEWARSLLIDQFLEVRHLIITTAVYHLPRCVLTFLQVMKDDERQIVISPIPLLNPNGISFSTEDFKSEVEKIQKYGAKGDVASIDYLNTYLQRRLS